VAVEEKAEEAPVEANQNEETNLEQTPI